MTGIIEKFSELDLWQQIIICYLLAINIIAFFYFGLDKLKARLNNHRISEKTLWLLAAIGGSAGALLGMHFFRHKTKKLSFQTVLAVILMLQIWVIYYIVYLNPFN